MVSDTSFILKYGNTQEMDPPVDVPIFFSLYTQTNHSAAVLPSWPAGQRTLRLPASLDTRQIWALSSLSVGHPSKPCYRNGACQLAQLALGKPPGASHGTSFALMVPDKPGSSVITGSKMAAGWTEKQRCNSWIKHTYIHMHAGDWQKKAQTQK